MEFFALHLHSHQRLGESTDQSKAVLSCCDYARQAATVDK